LQVSVKIAENNRNIDPRFNDEATCWHGDGTYEDCNNVLWTRNIMIRYKGGTCKWWHFFPTEDYAAVRSKFQVPSFTSLPPRSDLFYDFKNIFAKKIGEEYGVFDSKTKLPKLCKNMIITLVL
jgi:hypothetical protein